MEYYRLEFSEKQQWLRLDNYTHSENTDGFITIKSKCTDTEFKIFEAFLTKSDGLLLKNSKILYRDVDVLDTLNELGNFLKSLKEYNLNIS